jgi:hypothetical protein
VGVEPFEGLVKLLRGASGEGLQAAQNAAAEVYRAAIAQAAPRRTGALAGSVGIYRSVNRKQLTGDNLERLLVGPGKKTGYYGFFIEKGWIATGRARRERSGAGRTHGQKGVTGGRKIPGRPWFEAAVGAADDAAEKAAEATLEAKLHEIDSGI